MVDKVRIPEKDAAEVRKAVKLFEIQRQGKANVLTLLATEVKIKAMSEHIRSLAEAQMRGDHRPTKELNDIRKVDWDPGEVTAKWKKVVADYETTKTKWAEPAKATDLLFKAAVDNYSLAMQPLFDALEMAKTANIPRVNDRADKSIALLKEAQGTLPPLSAAAAKAIEDLDQFIMLMELLKTDPPQTPDEVEGARARFVESVQECRNADLAIQKQVQAINTLCKSLQVKIEQNIKDMVAAAIAWRNTADIREGAGWFETIANGAVEAVQVLDSEPMSAPAVQGIHMLVKGISTTITLSAAAYEAHQLGKTDVMDLVDSLKEDDFVQMKLDAIQMGLEWAAEPLGFIPNVGTLIRTAINIGTKQITGTLKKAAAKQAEAMQKKRKLAAKDFSEEIDVIQETLEECIKQEIENGIKGLANIDEYVKGSKDPTEVILGVVAAIFGPSLQAMLAKVIPDLGLTNPDTVKATLKGARASVDTLGHQQLEISKISLDFAYDEAASKVISVQALKALGTGESCSVVVAGSPQFKSTRGVGLLIGDGHSDDNVAYIVSLVKEGSGYEGTVTMKNKGGTASKGEVVFQFSDSKAKELVKSYVQHYGTGDNRITGKKLTFT
jgi:hypothetical protein